MGIGDRTIGIGDGKIGIGVRNMGIGDGKIKMDARTKRNPRKEMVRDVVAADVVQEEAACPAEHGAVDGGEGAADEGPLVLWRWA